MSAAGKSGFRSAHIRSRLASPGLVRAAAVAYRSRRRGSSVGVKESALLTALIALAALVFVEGVAIVVGLKFRRRIFAGPALSQGRLAPAQLVYSRYAQYTAGRSPLNRKSLRIGLAVLFLALAADQVGTGMTSHGRVLPFVSAAGWAVAAVTFGLVVPWTTRRTPVKLKQLRREIRERYPDDWA